MLPASRLTCLVRPLAQAFGAALVERHIPAQGLKGSIERGDCGINLPPRFVALGPGLVRGRRADSTGAGARSEIDKGAFYHDRKV
jgi:hypothetical protein